MLRIIPENIGAFDPTLVHNLFHDNTDQWWNNVDKNSRFLIDTFVPQLVQWGEFYRWTRFKI